MLGGTSGEGVHAVDVGLMANEVLHLRAMANCLWGGYHTFVFGSRTKLFEIVPGFLAGVPEFKTILKVPGF